MSRSTVSATFFFCTFIQRIFSTSGFVPDYGTTIGLLFIYIFHKSSSFINLSIYLIINSLHNKINNPTALQSYSPKPFFISYQLAVIINLNIFCMHHIVVCRTTSPPPHTHTPTPLPRRATSTAPLCLCAPALTLPCTTGVWPSATWLAG